MKNLIEYVIVSVVAVAILAHYANAGHWPAHTDRLAFVGVLVAVLVVQIIWRAAVRTSKSGRKSAKRSSGWAIVQVGKRNR